MKRNLKLMFALAMVLSFVLSACAPTAAPATVAGPTAVPPTPVVIVQVQTSVPQVVVATAAPVADRVQVYWYIGLGAGSQPAQIPLEKAFADKYNASQTKIQLIPIIVDNRYARDNLTAQLAADNAPDIVGPVGTAGRAAFPGQFLDLQPLIDKYKYDTGGIDPAF
jgi:ABC-type glycerol-3-phosphate transport system substrate-binding protein